MGLRETILAIDDKRIGSVEVPEWGCTIGVRSLTTIEMERWWDIVTDHTQKGIDPPGGRQVALVFMGTVNPDGTPLFRVEDLPSLGEKFPGAIDRVFNEIRRLSGMTKEEEAVIEKKPENQTSYSPTG